MLRRDRAFGKSKGAIAQDGQTPSLANGQRVNALSDLSANLGTVRYARILVGTGELGTDYTGVVITDDGVFYEGHYWHIAGLNNEALQFGLDAETGAAYAGGGAVLLDADGVTLYDDTTLVGRIGDLDGEFGVSGETWGFGFGDYSGGNYLTYDATNGFVLQAGDSALRINSDGLSLISGNTSPNRLKFVDGDTDSVVGYIEDYINIGSALHTMTLMSQRSQLAAEYGGGYIAGRIALLVESSAGVQDYLELYGNDAAWTGALLVGSTGSAGSTGTIKATAALISGGDTTTYGDLIVRRSAVNYTGHIHIELTTPLTSTSWDGDAKTTADNGVIDLSAVFGVPAGVAAVDVVLLGVATSAGVYYGVRPASSGHRAVPGRTQVANVYCESAAVCPCDANGDIYFVTSGNLAGVHLQIWGYYL